MNKVTELTADMTGTWEVTTQGSVHTWNLDEGWYARRRVREEQHSSMTAFPQEQKVYWVEVREWPQVGRTFLTILSGDIPWHRSSRIAMIQKASAL